MCMLFNIITCINRILIYIAYKVPNEIHLISKYKIYK